MRQAPFCRGAARRSAELEKQEDLESRFEDVTTKQVLRVVRIIHKKKRPRVVAELENSDEMFAVRQG